MFSTSSSFPPRGGKLQSLPVMQATQCHTKQGEDWSCQRDVQFREVTLLGHPKQREDRPGLCSPHSHSLHTAVSVGTEEARAECMPRIYAAYWLLPQWVCGARSCTPLPAAEKRMLETCTITPQLAHKHSYIHTFIQNLNSQPKW